MTYKEKLNRPILTLSTLTKPHDFNKLKDFSTTIIPVKQNKKGFDDNASSSVPDKEDVLVIQAKETIAFKYNFSSVYSELNAKFPEIIDMKNPVLLAISIRHQIIKEIGTTNTFLYKWIAWYFRKSNYYSIHKEGNKRYNLNGTEAGQVTQNEQIKRDKQISRIKLRCLSSKSSVSS